MELQYYGGNCLKITTKKANLIIDDNLEELGQKSITKADDISLSTNRQIKSDKQVKFQINRPGEYELSDISIIGIGARLHVDEKGKNEAVIYKIVVGDMRVVVVGHIYPELNEKQLEQLGVVDILVVPVGGNGFTVDPKGAEKLIKDVEPKIVIPTNYSDKQLKYPVEPQSLENFLKELAIEPKETTPKLKLKNTDIYTEKANCIVLERS